MTKTIYLTGLSLTNSIITEILEKLLFIPFRICKLCFPEKLTRLQKFVELTSVVITENYKLSNEW
jgi:hypothetical protein